MDGLVLDTEPAYFQTWQQAAAHLGYALPDSFFQSLSGLHWPAICQRLQTECGKDFPIAQFAQQATHSWQTIVTQHGIAVKSGFFELLTCIQQVGLPFCLATNSPRRKAQECLDYAGLSTTFPLLIGRDDVAEGKPAPDLFLKAAQLLNVPIHDCLILEDSACGLQAAHRAGAPVFLIPSLPLSQLPDHHLATHVFCDLHAVAKAMATHLSANPSLKRTLRPVIHS